MNIDTTPAHPKNGIATYILPLFTTSPQRRLAYIASCFAFAFTLFFLAPLDLYLNNTVDFNIGFSDAALPLFATCLAALAAGLLVFPLIFRGQALDFLSVTLCLLTAASYFQALFLNDSLINIMGDDETDIKAEITMNLINGFIWAIMIIPPLLIWKKFYNNPKYKSVKWETVIICVSVIVTGMRLTGCFAAISKYDVDVEMPYYLSYDKAFELSSNENICVFILDTLSVQYMDDALEQFPDLNAKLDGFTFYQNNVSYYPATFPSLALMLTGEYYGQAEYILQKFYFEKAWGKRVFIDILRENGYNSNLLLEKLSTFGNYGFLKNRADNIVALSENQIKINHYQIIIKTLKFSFEKISPYGWKYFFRINNADFSNDFYEWGVDDILPPALGDETDISFYERLKSVGLSARHDGNTFAVSHLNCSHDGGYRYNAETDELERGGTVLISTYGSFMILNEYFTQMKELGIYDNATIIILADHGSNEGAARTLTSALLIKPKNSHGSLRTDKTSELSHINFGASILETAGLPREGFGLSYFDIINGKLPQTREYIPYMLLEKDRFDKSTGKYQLFGKVRYQIIGDANNPDDWTYMETAD